MLVTGLLLASWSRVPGQESGAVEATFLGVKKSDRVGASGAMPDGKSDAVFSVKLSPDLTTNIDEIELIGSPVGSWSTSPKPGAIYLAVASSKTPSRIINPKPATLRINPKQSGPLLLFATDEGQFGPGAKFQLKVTGADGRTWTTQAPNELTDNSAAAGEIGGPIRMTAINRGLSQYDAVNPGKTMKGDDQPDGLFQLTIEAKNKTVTALEIRRVDGGASLWDTIPGSPAGAIGVALTSDPIKLLNQRAGAISIDVRDRLNLNLYVADNGDVAGRKALFRIAATFSDGEIAWTPVENVGPGAARPGVTKVNFLATWLGFVTTDAVGKYPGLKPDGTADAVFGLDIEVSPKSTITGLEINRSDGLGEKWGTTGTFPGAWGLGVAYQTAPTALLNKPDGSVSIPVEGRVQLYLYAADPGDISTTHQSYRIIVHLSDGSSYQQAVRKPLASTSTVAPGGDEPAKAKGMLSCEFRGFIADLVNTSTRPGKDGYLDGTFIMKLQIDNKKLTKIEISGSNGQVKWSSDPKPPIMLLGVATYPKIYKLINERPGPLQTSMSGKRTFYLYAADNGLLSDPKAVLTVTVTFSDKSSLKSEIIK